MTHVNITAQQLHDQLMASPIFGADGPQPPVAMTEEQMISQANNHQRDQIMALPEVPVVTRPSKRRLIQPKLKHEYLNLQDYNLRLLGTLISVGSDLYYVRNIAQDGKDFIFQVQNAKKKNFKLNYTKSGDVDLRTPEPKYTIYRDNHGWLFRLPIRQQKQGLCNENLRFKNVGSPRVDGTHDAYGIITAFQPRDNLVWTNDYRSLMMTANLFHRARLSDKLAVFKSDDGESLWAEYRGRPLGKIDDNVVIAELPADAEQPWIKRDCLRVGLNLRG